MLTGFFAGISGLYYNEQKLNVTSNNIANVDTTGFRKSLLMLKKRAENPMTDGIHPDAAERLPSSYGIERSGVYKNYGQAGELKHTGSDMDLAIPPELKNGFFSVKRADPTDPNVYYTRNGSLSIGSLDPSNPASPTALHAGGHLLLDASGQPIIIDAADGALSINNDGSIYQGETEVGKIPVYRLNKTADPLNQEGANLQMLNQLGDSLYGIPENRADEFFPMEIEVGQNGVRQVVTQGMLERSNVNVFNEMMEMMNTTRSAQANVTAIRQQLDSLGKLFEWARG